MLLPSCTGVLNQIIADEIPKMQYEELGSLCGTAVKYESRRSTLATETTIASHARTYDADVMYFSLHEGCVSNGTSSSVGSRAA